MIGRNLAGVTYTSASEEILVYIMADREEFSVRTLPPLPDPFFFGTGDGCTAAGTWSSRHHQLGFFVIPMVAPGVGCNPT